MLFAKAQDFMSSASKYGNRKVTIDSHKFDSVAESKYYMQLKWLEANKQILFFRLQPRYLLQEAFDKGGQHFRKIEYVSDFEVHHLDGSIEVIDVKGVETEAFKIKRKLFEKKYPHKLSLITYKKEFGGWIELEKLKKLERKVVKPHGKKKTTKVGAPVSERRRESGLPI
ncbi:DUF1064 domain-containing protein [Bacillus sp. 1NLA3E]|uniref:DUF1064 domain-containing protein n=1 Tax=Bacillus sp. 1NLA3E TaxID=666686 RepID=UPI000247E666|nr:DUF1064 domain-containing protein [Bacillus sp. 1NLA3E]AGK52012.1 hypothetical protein B1NLA3E_01140 [Bacillus sp. 1NLA3E]